MKPLKLFDDFIKEGIIKKQSIDRPRAQHLIEEAERKNRSLSKILDKIGLNDDNANDIIEYCYDIIISLIRANMLLNGYGSSGSGAHEAEVSYLRNLNISEKEVQFTNQLRYFRNGILYYGKNFDTDYGNKIMEFLNKIYPKLKTLTQS